MTGINAWAAKKAGGKLEPFSYEVAELAADEVEIEVTSCGICHSDLSILNNDWGVTRYPVVPGHEVIGKIAAVGASVIHLEVGQTVGIGWNVRSCLTCHQCMSGAHHHCAKTQATIVGHHGGFADRLRAQAAWAVPVPDGISAEEAGPLFCGGITVFSPIEEYDIKPTDRVGVIGIGGLGHLALQFLRAWGCETWAFTTSPDKSEELKKLGAHHVADTRDDAGLKALRGKFDAIISTVNVSLPWGRYIAALAPEGKFISVGAITEPMDLPPQALISGQKSIGGSDIGPPARVARMLNFCARHGIAPQVETFPMDEVNEAIAHLESGKARYRVVLTR
ncbi:NAD(P)-dependent alcohol dehydrogenase [Parvularcula sp. IMCC14364]|uniref:NADPH-dependent aldehyde reductase Ahr n=1 Tax=Parvularcula sp. IMCC14364 TaxID=3067902 RepID=UPI0027404C82|nr:NAD(P)-dependent alcohol dehydrogenase [Parvularcula sp. IMCC14364]